MNLQLIASGRDFDVDAFLSTTTLACDRVFRRGERATEFFSGFTATLGDASELSYDQQVRAAVEFITKHREQLTHLMKWPGVANVEIGLCPAMTPPSAPEAIPFHQPYCKHVPR